VTRRAVQMQSVDALRRLIDKRVAAKRPALVSNASEADSVASLRSSLRSVSVLSANTNQVNDSFLSMLQESTVSHPPPAAAGLIFDNDGRSDDGAEDTSAAPAPPRTLSVSRMGAGVSLGHGVGRVHADADVPQNTRPSRHHITVPSPTPVSPAEAQPRPTHDSSRGTVPADPSLARAGGVADHPPTPSLTLPAGTSQRRDHASSAARQPFLNLDTAGAPRRVTPGSASARRGSATSRSTRARGRRNRAPGQRGQQGQQRYRGGGGGVGRLELHNLTQSQVLQGHTQERRLARSRGRGPQLQDYEGTHDFRAPVLLSCSVSLSFMLSLVTRVVFDAVHASQGLLDEQGSSRHQT